MKLENDSKYKVMFGTLDKHNPSVIYIKSSTKVKPTVQRTNYKDEIGCIKKSFLDFVSKVLTDNDTFLGEYICQFNTNEMGMSYKKNSFVKYELYVKPRVVNYIDGYQDVVGKLTASLNARLDKLLMEKDFVYA